MDNFEILTESTCDLGDDYCKENNVKTFSLTTILDGITYTGRDGNVIEPKPLYAAMRSGKVPSTSMITPDIMTKFLEPYAEKDIPVLYLSFSSALSGTCNSVMASIKELKNKYPVWQVRGVDTLCASLGQGLLVDYCVDLRKQGKTLDEVADFAENNKLKICHYFTVSDLLYLHRGGRVSKTVAIIGSLVNIKPVLHVDDLGRLISIGKVIGRKKAIARLVDYMVKKHPDKVVDKLFISHGDCIDDANIVLDEIKKKFDVKKTYINYVDSVIGSHSGPDTLSIFFLGTDREEK
jgi:DegV family protein with EDD domain